MAIYRSVSLSFWTDPKVIDDFSPEDKYFYLYLLTNPHTNLIGCYEISLKQISDETGYTRDTIEKLIDRFTDIHKVIKYSKATKEVLLLNWTKHNWTRSPKLMIAIDNQIEEIKNQEYKQLILDLKSSFLESDDIEKDTVSIPYLYRSDTTVSVTDTNTNTITNTVTNTNTDSLKDFYESIWKLYPIKKGKGQVSIAKKKALQKIGYEHIARCIDRFVNDMQGRDKQYWMHGSTFFNSGYVDYLDDNYTPPEKPTFANKTKNKASQLDYLLNSIAEDEKK